MVHVNLSATKQFGYTVNDVLNKKVNCIMAPLFSHFHDGILTEVVTNKDKRDWRIVKERFIPGKHKNGYLIPIYLLIRPMGLLSNETSELKFFAELRVDKQYKTTVYIVTNVDGMIEEASSGWTKVLKGEKKWLEKS